MVVNQTADCSAPSTVATTISTSGSSAPYTLAAPAGDYLVIAQQDVDGDGALDYEGGYGYDPASDAYQIVTPPAQGIDITLQAVGGTDPGPTPPPSGEGISGTWSGTTTTQSFGSEQTTLSLTQSDTQVSGTLTLTDSSGGSFSTDVTGSVSGSTATVSGLFTLEGGGTLEYRYEGTFSETVYSGTVTLLVDGAAQEQGEFSVTKGADALSSLKMREPQAVRQYPMKRPAW